MSFNVKFSKENFCKGINSIMEIEDYILDIEKKGISFNENSPIYKFISNKIDFIENLMKDSEYFHENEDIIEYFCYDLNFGRSKNAEKCIKDNNNNYISLRNAEELWDYIVKDYVGEDYNE